MNERRLDTNGQPVNTAFCFRRNKEKAAYALRGLLQGVVADQKLEPRELLFLDTWLRTQQALDDGDVVDLLDLIGDVLADGTVTGDELAEIYALIEDIIEFSEQTTRDEAAAINELLGLVTGIVADGVVDLSEFAQLDQWIGNNPDVSNHWPANVIAQRLRHIAEDGVVEPEELEELKTTLQQMCGYSFEETGAADGGVAEVFEDGIQIFEHDGKTICFTGKFVCGTRKNVENTASKRGAQVVRNVSGRTDALVVGTLASRDWRFTSHGRKIEKALQLRNDGREIIILSERTWRGFI